MRLIADILFSLGLGSMLIVQCAYLTKSYIRMVRAYRRLLWQSYAHN